MNTSILKPPANLPITWEIVKQHLRVDELSLGEQADNEQAYIMNILVASAAKTATQILRQALIETQYETRLFPHELRRAQGFSVLSLPWANALTVDAVTYGGAALVEGTDYRVPKDSEDKPLFPGQVIFASGLFGQCCGGSWYGGAWCGCWPTLEEAAEDVISVTYTAGFGTDPDDVPANIQNWLLLRVGATYTNREETADVRNIATLPFIDQLLGDRNYTFS